MAEEQQNLTKEEWRQRLKEEGRDQVIRKEMVRLGFWAEEEVPPAEQEQIEQEEAELQTLRTEQTKLRLESSKLGNMDQLLQEARKKRIVESQQRRAKRKEQRRRARKDALQRWREYRMVNIIHAGVGVSSALQQTESQEQQLRTQQLPPLAKAMDLAAAMGISLGKLKWLTYHRETATINHYTQFTVPKKGGGIRQISAPKSDLRTAQAWVKEQILDKLPIHARAFGFVPGRSTVDHAREHLQRAAVVKLDLEDFFPTITFPRVRGLFRSVGFSGQISSLLALLCTEPPRQTVQFADKQYHVALDERQLPQGATTSPSITNIICRRLDARLQQLAENRGFIYSRYADDLTFSCDEKGLKEIGALIREVRQTIRHAGFRVNEQKTRILRASARQKVTGIVVNEKPNISRRDLRTFRALLHNVEKNGLQAENKDNHPNFLSYIQGYASYIRMVRPDLAEKLAQQVQRIVEREMSLLVVE